MTVTHVRVPLVLEFDPLGNLIEPGDTVNLDTLQVFVKGSKVYAEFDVDDKHRLSNFDTIPDYAGPTEYTALSIAVLKDLADYEAEYGTDDEVDQRVKREIEIDGEPYIVVAEFWED